MGTTHEVELAAWCINYTIESLGKIYSNKKERHRLEKDARECWQDAEKAFIARIPPKAVIDPEILTNFFQSPVFKNQYDCLLKGNDYNLIVLEKEFYDSGYEKGSIKGFYPNLAISDLFDQFIHSAGQKASLVDIVIPIKESEGYRGRYLDQLIKDCENLRFGGIPGAYGQEEIKLGDIFITLQASQQIPEVDILFNREEQHKPVDQVYNPDSERVSTRESTRILKVTDAFNENNNMVILGAPGAGKTTFMRYLALSFAQNQSQKQLDVDEDRLPILITLRDMVSAESITNKLVDRINEALETNLPDSYFHSYLETGRCIVLFDGLDEVANIRERGEIARKVSLFANAYKGNRYIITSRIAGYREIQQLPGSDFPHLTIRDFDDQQIESFAKKWYKGRHPTEADRRTDDLLQAFQRNSKVKQLATNPLMLTIIAVVHRSSAELPSERIKLYDQCTEALLYSWQREQKRPRLKDIHGNLIPDNEVRRRLEHLAYWMHSEVSTDAQQQAHVRYLHLKVKLAEQLVNRKKVDAEEAEDEAEAFLEYVRKTTGVLMERGTELYGFVHLTFQEYFAACDIYRRCGSNVEKIWEEISPRLHDSHWREVIRLLIAKLSGSFDEVGEQLIQEILRAKTPYDDLLKRNLLLAAACLADDIEVEEDTYQQIIDNIINIVIHSPYDVQKVFATDALRELANSRYEGDVIDKLIPLLDDSEVRGRAASALGSIGKADDSVIHKLIKLLDDDDSQMRGRAASALGSIGKADDSVIDKLIKLLSYDDSEVRGRAASALVRIGKADDRVIDKLIPLLDDSQMRGIAAYALGSIGKADDRVIDELFTLLDESQMRERAASALGSIGKADDRVIDKLITLLDGLQVYGGVKDALVSIGKADDRVIDKLIALLDDSEVRWGATYALGSIGKADDRVIDKLILLLSDDDSQVRWRAASALGSIGKADDRVIDKLITLLDDSEVRWGAASALVSIGKADDRVIDNLITLLDDPRVRGRAVEALESIGKADDRVIDKLITLLDDSEVRGRAVEALGRTGKADDRVIDKLITLLDDPQVRGRAASALGRIGKADDRVIDKLITLLDDLQVRGRAADALVSIGKADDRVIDKLIVLLDDSQMRGKAAGALASIRPMNEKILNSLEIVCRKHGIYSGNYVSDPDEGEFRIEAHDLAFRTLFRYALGRFEEGDE